VLQFHKGFPITLCKLEDLSPLDIQQAALDFPDLIFAIHHLALPYFEETVYIAERFPNVHLVLSGTMNLPVVAPWEFKMYNDERQRCHVARALLARERRPRREPGAKYYCSGSDGTSASIRAPVLSLLAGS
jgi:Amidohydrolase